MTADRDAPKPRTGAARRFRAVLANLAILAGSLGFALLACEIAVRVISPRQLILKRPDMWQPDDTVGWVHQRNANTTVNTGEGTVHFVTDTDGNRVGVGGRIDGGVKVLLLGDSFMEALQVEYAESVAGLMETRLSAAVGTQVAVRNVAVGGWDPDQYLIQLRRSLARDSVAVVVTAMFMGNDIVLNRRDRVPARVPVEEHRLRIPRRASWREIVDAVLYPVNDFLEVRSQLFILAKSRLQGLLVRLGLSAAYFPPALLRSNAGSRMWDNTASICADIAAVAKAHHTPVIFVLLPNNLQVDQARLNAYLTSFHIAPATVDVEQPNRRMRDALVPQGIEVVDATPALRTAHARGEKLYGDVDEHFTRAGHKVVADTLVPMVLTRLRAAPAIRRPTK
jgi:hypothetical protein